MSDNRAVFQFHWLFAAVTLLAGSVAIAEEVIDAFIADVQKPVAAPVVSEADRIKNIDGFDWMASGAREKEILHNLFDGRPDLATITGTNIPKATADASAFTREYLIDLKQFGISSDGTNPVETSRGINGALQHAKEAGANRIVFPKGTYLISEADPIVFDHKDTVVDFNGSILQMNPNGLTRYTVVEVRDGASNLRLTNGQIKGDRDAHDYKTVKGTHEHCMGITFSGGRQLEVDHLTISDVPGSGVSTRVVGGRGARSFYFITAKDLVLGEFSDTGEKVAGSKKLITTKAYDISNCGEAFEFGYTLGYQGYPSVKGRSYQAYFYDENNVFIEKRDCLQFQSIAIPRKAKFVRLEFNQAEIKNGAEGMVGRLTNLAQPVDVHFHNNHMINNRTLGMAFCGGQKWIIEHNLFEANGGNAPGFGVDFEDGWDLMREIVFRNNNFKANRAGDLVVCAGTEMIFEGNTFAGAVILYDRTNNYAFKGNTITGGRVLFKTGIKHAEIHDNRYIECRLEVRWNENKWQGVPPLTLTGETLERMAGIAGGHLVFVDSTITASRIVANKDTRLIHFRNCDLTGVAVEADAKAVAGGMIFEDSRITMSAQPLVKMTADKLGLLKLAGNTIDNQSDHPVIDLLLPPAPGAAQAPLPDGRIVLENNRITQSGSTHVIAGPTMNRGAIQIVISGNQTASQPVSPDLLRGKAVQVTDGGAGAK